ncbi:hypothetical protein COV06_00890 [Candidatus Uhrbacteria bacterium CG10_big_fil_rev_8_21_14_0_10_50_16]|uniref:NTP pyrophosphohydrolase MazG-like domain-containing protein n=1 Tax=Candidatus Uhrbacteria bacterium CG10_big_fil_rev_8_21_14_0_10_50_16 TaxID=1975039 RepID=A0A2H0RN22_9BACT|nr:MAG: hypothetical protein COV06_00890 [Candidatus Uhrbacteria bacterium CG10_big_fil_rev_8_21_14_0_10_50_16]
MTFNDYQTTARTTAIYPDLGSNYVYPTLGLVGEAGEVAEKVKKILRGGEEMTDEQQQEIVKELGDVLWYISNLATELNITLDELADRNLQKLLSRKDRGVLHGNGDNR